jgi:hypothetical protein
MDLQPYVDGVRHELGVAAAAGGADAAALADRLTAPLDSAIRLALLEALSDAAEQITRELAPRSVDVRLRGRDPEFTVSPGLQDLADEPVSAVPESDDDGVFQIHVARLAGPAVSGGHGARRRPVSERMAGPRRHRHPRRHPPLACQHRQELQRLGPLSHQTDSRRNDADIPNTRPDHRLRRAGHRFRPHRRD